MNFRQFITELLNTGAFLPIDKLMRKNPSMTTLEGQLNRTEYKQVRYTMYPNPVDFDNRVVRPNVATDVWTIDATRCLHGELAMAAGCDMNDWAGNSLSGYIDIDMLPKIKEAGGLAEWIKERHRRRGNGYIEGYTP